MKRLLNNPVLKKVTASLLLGGSSWIFYYEIIKPTTERFLGTNPYFSLGVAIVLILIAYKLIGRDIKF